MSLYRERCVKRTRKQCTCDWCWQKIEAGEPSVTTSGLCEGDFFSSRYHPECIEAVHRYVSVNRCWGEPLPDDPMNRGGIEPRGEPEAIDAAKGGAR